jgi:hypothetical protein
VRGQVGAYLTMVSNTGVVSKHHGLVVCVCTQELHNVGGGGRGRGW